MSKQQTKQTEAEGIDTPEAITLPELLTFARQTEQAELERIATLAQDSARVAIANNDGAQAVQMVGTADAFALAIEAHEAAKLAVLEAVANEVEDMGPLSATMKRTKTMVEEIAGMEPSEPTLSAPKVTAAAIVAAAIAKAFVTKIGTVNVPTVDLDDDAAQAIAQMLNRLANPTAGSARKRTAAGTTSGRRNASHILNALGEGTQWQMITAGRVMSGHITDAGALAMTKVDGKAPSYVGQAFGSGHATREPLLATLLPGGGLAWSGTCGAIASLAAAHHNPKASADGWGATTVTSGPWTGTTFDVAVPHPGR